MVAFVFLQLHWAHESLLSSGSPAAEQRSPSQNASCVQADGTEECVNFFIYPYERLKVMSNDPVADINVTKREVHTSSFFTERSLVRCNLF